MIVLLVIVLLTVSLAFAQNGDGGGEEEKPAVVQQRPNEESTGAGTAARFDGGGTTYCYTQTVTIPDNWPYGFTATMFVSDSLTIDDLNLILTATHSSVGDLSFELFYVNFNTNVYTSRLVYNRPGFPTTSSGCEGDDVAATINDEGLDGDLEYTCLAGTPAIAGDLVGDDPPNTKSMADFNGADLAGVYWWILAIDHAAGDSGTLDGWCVEVNSNEAPDIEVNPASLSSIQLPDIVVTQPLTISNLGNINLNWTINEVSSATNSGSGMGGCSPNDIPWLNVNPMNGATSPGNSDQVEVTFDSAGMVTGVYTALLCIESNDLASPVLDVLVTLTVEAPTAVSLSDFFGHTGDSLRPTLLVLSLALLVAAVLFIRRRHS
jgi:subtilisin-like proprotein convertase family protein